MTEIKVSLPLKVISSYYYTVTQICDAKDIWLVDRIIDNLQISVPVDASRLYQGSRTITLVQLDLFEGFVKEGLNELNVLMQEVACLYDAQLWLLEKNQPGDVSMDDDDRNRYKLALRHIHAECGTYEELNALTNNPSMEKFLFDKNPDDWARVSNENVVLHRPCKQTTPYQWYEVTQKGIGWLQSEVEDCCSLSYKCA